MDGVGTPIIGRPRPLPGHDTPNPAYHPHTLNYEEPVKVPVDTVKMHQNGGWVDPIQVTFVSGWVRKDVTKNVVVQLWFYRNASQEHSGQGELQDIPAGKFASLVTLKFDGVEWKVQEIYVEEK